LLPPTGITNLASFLRIDTKSSGYDLGAAAHKIPSYLIDSLQSIKPSPCLNLTL